MSNDHFIAAEDGYGRQRVALDIAASRAGRTRHSWLRRIAAADRRDERRFR